MDYSHYQLRRQKLLSELKTGDVVILQTAPEVLRNADTHYPYRPGSDFYYLTGFDEPEAIAVLIAGKKSEFILFNRPNDPVREQWEGPRSGQSKACSLYGADAAYPIGEFQNRLSELVKNQKRIFCLAKDEDLLESINSSISNSAVFEFQDLASILYEMRLIKDEVELDLMRAAASISAHAHRKAMQSCRAGIKEYELAAVIEYGFKRHGCEALAYPSIVAAGSNACVLHYTSNQSTMQSNDLVLVDAGGEYHYYASDITRTYPVSGVFSTEQRAIYELVLDTQMEVIASIRAGRSRGLMQELSENLITQGLLDLGLLKGDLKELLASRAFAQFYMHRIGHWIGLDVHDVGVYQIEGQWRELKAGMVLTIEPGIYISPNSEGVDPKWWGIGVRIEDDILVTEEGCEVLSVEAPKSVGEIERLMAKNA